MTTSQDDLGGGPIAWMARNSIAANLLMFLLLGSGIWAVIEIQKEVFPQFQLDVVEVQVEYPGASPEEVEQSVLQPVEEAIRGLSGIDEMTSVAREGSASVTLELVPGTDRMKAFQDIDQAVGRIRTFPDDAEEPEVQLQTRQRDVMEIGLYGDVDVWTLRKLGERLRDELLSHPSITQVELRRVPDYVTHVEIPLAKLREHGLTLGQIARLIESSSRDIPAGSVETNTGEILLRMKERKQWAEDFAGIAIQSSESGTVLTLGEIATIRDGFDEGGFHSQFNRQPSVELRIFRVGDQSPLEIAAAVEVILAEFGKSLPDSIKTRIDSSSAEDYRDRLSLLLDNGGLAILIVLGILGIFLQGRLAFWVMLGMVVSFVGGLALLPPSGVSINMISMFAFLVVLGIVVDDAIVVGENVFEARQRGLKGLAAAVQGTREVSGPVVFSILSTIVAFIPLMFIPGETGQFWWPLPAVVILILAVSLVEALYILPAHLAHSAEHARSRLGRWLERRQASFANGFAKLSQAALSPFLNLALRARYLTLSIAIAILAVLGAWSTSAHMGMILMPEVAADEIEAGVRLPVDTTLEQAAVIAERITAATWRMFEEHDLHRVAEGVKTNVRRQTFIDVEIVLRPPDERDMRAKDVIALWRDQIGDIKGVDQISFQAERGPGGWRDDIEVDLGHQDLDMLEKAGAAFIERVKGFTNTRDVKDNYNRGQPQFDFELRKEARAMGLDAEMVGRQIRDAFYGALAMRQLRNTNEIEVRVKLPLAERQELRVVEDYVIRTPDGAEVPLSEVASVRQAEAFTSINRRGGRRVITVGMDVEPTRATGQVIESITNEILPQLRSEYPGLTWSFRGNNAEMREATRALWGGFGLAMAVIYALLAVAFRSYLQPLIVMAAIPFGIIGAVVGHIIFGYDLSLISLMGVIALSGVVVNDSLIMVDYANRHRGSQPAFAAIHAAALRRFRPIFLTTLTTFAGLTPIIFETSRQAYYLVPMAISLGFGILFATAIIMVIVPCLYLAVEDLKRMAGHTEPTPPPS